MAYFPPTGSVVAFQSDPTKLVGTVSIVGNMNSSITAYQGGAWSTSITGGYVNVIGSVLTVGSITALQGTNPWIVNMPSPSVLVIQPGGSVMNVNVSGSVAAVINNSSVLALQGTLPWVIQSIVGTYSEDAAHATTDKGIFTLMVRNDTLSSITSSDVDYSPHVVDAVGRTIIKPFAGENATIISYTGSVVSASVTLIQPSVIGSRSYITDFWVTNTGSVAQLVTFQGGDTSVVGYTIAPAGGGSNSPGIAIPLKTTLSQDLAFKTTGTSSVIYMTIKGYQAP